MFETLVFIGLLSIPTIIVFSAVIRSGQISRSEESLANELEGAVEGAVNQAMFEANIENQKIKIV